MTGGGYDALAFTHFPPLLGHLLILFFAFNRVNHFNHVNHFNRFNTSTPSLLTPHYPFNVPPPHVTLALTNPHQVWLGNTPSLLFDETKSIHLP